jgi:regulator of protease activity HflC (stomatin/prohibitin superfamily)
MYLMETTDENFKIPMDVLCNDSLNFKFTLDILISLDLNDVEAVKNAFQDLKPEQTPRASGEPYVITLNQLAETYVIPNAAQEAQKVISRYSTDQLVKSRASVIEEVQAAVTASSQHGMVKIKRVSLTDLDFPDVVTDAQEARAKKVVEIETARARGEAQVAEAQADLKVAQIQAQKRLLDAQSVADANAILGASITPQFIAYEQIQTMGKAAAGDNNVFFVPYNEGMTKPLNTSAWMDQAINAELIKRVEAAKEAADQPFVEP